MKSSEGVRKLYELRKLIALFEVRNHRIHGHVEQTNNSGHERAQMDAIFTAPLKTFGFLVYQRRTACREIEPRVNRAISKIPRW